MLLSICTGKKYRKNKNKIHSDIDEVDDENSIAPVIFQQKHIDLPTNPQFDDELDTRRNKKGISIYVGGQLTPAIPPPNLNIVTGRNHNTYNNNNNNNNNHFDIDYAAINDEVPPKIKPRKESYGQKIIDTSSIGSISFSDADKSIISHRRYSSHITRSSISSHHERRRHYSDGPDNSFYDEVSMYELSRFNYFDLNEAAINNTSHKNTNNEEISQNIYLKHSSEEQNLMSFPEESLIHTNNKKHLSSSNINNLPNEIIEINENYINPNNTNNDKDNDNINVNNNNNNNDINNIELSERNSQSSNSSSISLSKSKSKSNDTNKTFHSEHIIESGKNSSKSEILESSESEMKTKNNKSLNKSDGNINSGINNDTTLKDPSPNKDGSDEIPTLTNNKDADTTENNIDSMNSMEKLKYIENSYDRIVGSALPMVENNNKEEYINQNNNVKITEDLNEYSLQDESSLFDDAPQEIRASYPIPSPKKKIKILIFGTRDSWYIQYENGEESWNNIPTFLQWRLEVIYIKEKLFLVILLFI